MATRRALVFGGSGQIGERVLERLLATGWEVTAWSRQPRAPRPGLTWQQGDLSQPPAAALGIDAIFSCGPLDHFAHWYAAHAIKAARVVAFGSTSLQVKQRSIDAAERDVAQRLDQAEQRLFAAAAKRGTAATVLRPTLVYGAGRDRTLTRIARIAQRSGVFVLPRAADGLRQPVHVDDLAQAAMDVLDRSATYQRSYALGGGEVLSYRQMVERVLAALGPSARLYRLPTSAFASVLWVAHRAGRLRGMSDAVLLRMREDLVFDLEPARRDFGYSPRVFRPGPAELGVG